MEQVDIRWLFSLLRSAIDEKKLSDNERACVALCQNELLEIAKWHDLAHLVAYALQKNDLPCNDQDEIWQAVYR